MPASRSAAQQRLDNDRAATDDPWHDELIDQIDRAGAAAAEVDFDPHDPTY